MPKTMKAVHPIDFCFQACVCSEKYPCPISLLSETYLHFRGVRASDGFWVRARKFGKLRGLIGIAIGCPR